MAGPYDALNSFLSDEAIAALNEAANNATNNVVQPPAYPSNGRPDASTVPAGTIIFNASTGVINVSDGTAWRNAVGVLT
jgi:hypothetical protein